MTKSTPKVTIGLMVYNGENYLADALESILAQTFSDFEIVISDNGSTDGTAEICRRFARADRRIRFYRHEQNRGAAWNYNRVFQLARGEYFKWMAHDDAIEPEYLAKCVALLDARPDVVWCQTHVVLIDGQGRRLRGNINAWNDPRAMKTDVHSVAAFDPGGRRGDRTSPRASERFAAVLLGAAWCLDGYGLIRASALRKTRGYLATYGSEKIIVGELSLLGCYAEVPQPLKLVRIHEASSGGLCATAQQQDFMGKRKLSRWIHPRLQLLMDQIVSPIRMPLPFAERLRCLSVVSRYLFQVRKWHLIVSSMVRRKGTGGGNQLFIADDGPPHEEPASAMSSHQRTTANAQRTVGGVASLIAMMDATPPSP